MTLITQAQTRKERRKQERKKRKQQHGRQHQTVVEKEPDLVPKLKKSKKDETSKVVKQAEIDPYGTLNPDEAAAIRRDDEEIAELEMKLGLVKSKKGKDKLNKEYARLEGYGDDFGDFLGDLDDIVRRVTVASKTIASKEKKKREKEKKKTKSDFHSDMDPDVVAAIRRDDDEIAELEQKLGLGKKKDKSKLHKEYAKLEGYGDDFGEFLDDLDDVIVRVTKAGNESDYKKSYRDPTASEDYEDDNNSEVEYSDTPRDIENDTTSEDSDGEELVPMKDPHEALDEDDSVLEELERIQAEDEKKGEDLGTCNEGNESEVDSCSESSDESIEKVSDSAHPEVEDSDGSGSATDSGDESDISLEQEPDHNIVDTYQPSKGEDIYGNRVDADNSGGARPTKYVPPHLRKRQGEDDKNEQERQRLIQRSLNNALNRLSEDTLISVAQQVSQLYSSHPTLSVHEMIWKNTKNACIERPMVMTGLVPVYIACIIGVHIQTGDTVQVGEYMLEQVVTQLWSELHTFRQKSSEDSTGKGFDETENKQISNLMLIVCYLYNFNIVHCAFMYDIIRHLIDKFSEVDIECLLLLLSHCGRSLRSDDPLALKEIVLLVQKKKTKDSIVVSTSRAEYMVSAIMDLKNNKRRKQDDVFTEKISKFRKLLGRIKSTAAKSNTAKTTSEASLRISLLDILNAETKGRWWKVGASWVGNQYRFTEDGKDPEAEDSKDSKKAEKGSEQDEKLLRLASKYRMNTDRKRAIFCIIMGGTDCDDAFEKLCRSSMLQNRSERDAVRVLMECCGNEKSYNKFYGHLAARICEFQPQSKFSLQLAYWDAFKQFEQMDARKVANFAKLLFHLVVTHHTLKLMTVLKALEVSADEMEDTALIFLTILMTSILDHFEHPSMAKALFENKRSKDEDTEDPEEGVRASLLLFFLETLKASPKNKKGSRFRKNFKAVVKALDTDGFENMF